MSAEDLNGQLTEEELNEILMPLLTPYIEELNKIEKSYQQKQREVIILKHAANDVLQQIKNYREKLKKLPKGKITSEILKNTEINC